MDTFLGGKVTLFLNTKEFGVLGCFMIGRSWEETTGYFQRKSASNMLKEKCGFFLADYCKM